MTDNNLSTAQAYYQALADKNVSKAETCLHPDVQIVSPLDTVTGKNDVTASLKGFVNIFNTLEIRVKFSNENQVMLAIDFDCHAPIGNFRTAVLMTFKDHLIIKNELFYDARPLEKMRDEIFSSGKKT